jgi:hypothetical protein
LLASTASERQGGHGRWAGPTPAASDYAYRALAEHLPDVAIFVFDQDLRFKLATGAGLAKSAWRTEEIIGRTVDELFPPKRAELLAIPYRAALAGERGAFEVVGSRSQPDHVWAIDVVPLRAQTARWPAAWRSPATSPSSMGPSGPAGARQLVQSPAHRDLLQLLGADLVPPARPLHPTPAASSGDAPRLHLASRQRGRHAATPSGRHAARPTNRSRPRPSGQGWRHRDRGHAGGWHGAPQPGKEGRRGGNRDLQLLSAAGVAAVLPW